jgi:hypothetical protein
MKNTKMKHIRRLAGNLPGVVLWLAVLPVAAFGQEAGTVYIGNSLTVPNGGPDGLPPLVILGEYSPAGPLASSTVTLPTGTVQDVKFYGQDYSFTLYALSLVTNGPNPNEQTFTVVASESFSGSASTLGIQTLPVSGFLVNAGDFLAFAGAGPYYPQNPNDATNSDAAYEDSSNPGSFIATPPGGPGSVFTVGLNPDPSANYEYIPDYFGNQGRNYGIGVDVSLGCGISIDCPNNIVATTSSNSLVVAFSVNARDSCSTNFTLISEPPSGTEFALGTTTVTNTVTDSLGNSNTCSFSVTVLPRAAGCVPPPSGLVNWWPGEGNAVDSVGGNNGTLEGGVTYTNGDVGQAFNFDGASGFISTASLITNPQTFTLSLWFRTTTTQGGVLISFDESQTSVAPNSGYYDRNIYMDNIGALHFGFWNPGPLQINSAAGYNDNNWHWAVGSLSASTGLSFYLDGVLVENNPAANVAAIYNGWWRIGECDLDNWPFHPSSVYFKGEIDEVAIFNRVLSPAEVYAIYAAGSAGMCSGQPYAATATATATVVDDFVVGVTITDGGSGYTNTPTVSIIGGGGSGAQAVAVVSNGVVIAVNILDAGSGYTNPPVIVIAPPFLPQPMAATATATLVNDFVVGATVTDGGFGYTNTPTVTIIGGGGSGAQAVAVVSNGVVIAVNILDAGSGYTNPPVIVIAPPFLPQPTLCIAAMSLLSFTNLAVGTNYQLQSFSAGTWSDMGAAFTAAGSAFTQYVPGTASANSYRLAATPVPSQAYATAQLDNGFMVGTTVTSGGSGYATIPAVSITGGGGNGAEAVAVVSNGVVIAVDVMDAGYGYTNAPAIIIAPPPPPATALWPTVTQAMELDLGSLWPYGNYQLEFSPVAGGVWSNLGLPFTSTSSTSTQSVNVSGNAGFFRLAYVP